MRRKNLTDICRLEGDVRQRWAFFGSFSRSPSSLSGRDWNAEVVGDCGIALTNDLKQTVASLTEKYRAFVERVRSERPRFLVDRAAREYVAAFADAVAHTP